MNNRINIENEWRSLVPGMEPVSPVVPYSVPQGYFESFPESMLMLVKGDPALSFRKEELTSTYQIPTGYFEELPGKMLAKVKALENGSVSEEMEVLSPLLSGLGKKTPYSVPDGYFKELPANLADGARAIEIVNEELENLSPMMNQLRTVQPYEVPVGYFENFDQQMLNKVAQPKGGKLISMGGARKWMRYAAAAAVAGLVFIGAMKIFNQGPKAITGPELAKISDTEIIQYLNQQASDPVAVTNESAGNDVTFTSADMKDMLADVSDEELQKYVDQQVSGEPTITN